MRDREEIVVGDDMSFAVDAPPRPASCIEWESTHPGTHDVDPYMGVIPCMWAHYKPGTKSYFINDEPVSEAEFRERYEAVRAARGGDV